MVCFHRMLLCFMLFTATQADMFHVVHCHSGGRIQLHSVCLMPRLQLSPAVVLPVCDAATMFGSASVAPILDAMTAFLPCICCCIKLSFPMYCSQRTLLDLQLCCPYSALTVGVCISSNFCIQRLFEATVGEAPCSVRTLAFVPCKYSHTTRHC